MFINSNHGDLFIERVNKWIPLISYRYLYILCIYSLRNNNIIIHFERTQFSNILIGIYRKWTVINITKTFFF